MNHNTLIRCLMAQIANASDDPRNLNLTDIDANDRDLIQDLLDGRSDHFGGVLADHALCKKNKPSHWIK